MYLIFDLDDTLLTSDSKITKYTKNVISKLQKKGHIIVINSARSYEYLDEYIHSINPNYCICDGGTEIFEHNKLVFKNHIPNETVNEAICLFKENNITTFSVFNKNLYTQNLDYISQNAIARYYDFSKPFNMSASKITFKSPDDTIANLIAKKLNLKLIKYLNGNWYRLSTSSKELGNKELFHLLKDDDPKDICFGDDVGDIEMLKSAYLGVAMKNSVPEVLEIIQDKTKYDNDSDGVAKYLCNLERKGIL